MTTTLDHLQAPRRSASTTPAVPVARRTARAAAERTGWLTLLGESIAAARAISSADPGTSVAVARRFAARINA